MTNSTQFFLMIFLSLSVAAFFPLDIVVPNQQQEDAYKMDENMRQRLFSSHANKNNTILPIVLWHGMGDSCCNPMSMGYIKELFEHHIPGVEVYSIEIGDSMNEDIWNSFFMNVNDQLEMVHQNLSGIPSLAQGFNAVGFSQGGQFWRAYVERYNQPPVKTLLSVGGQHQGVASIPECSTNITICSWITKLIDLGIYTSFVQDNLVQAEYFQDPFNYDAYVNKSVFLSDINNNKLYKNETYKNNLKSLDQLVLVKFENDTIVQPRESEHFGFYEIGSDTTLVPLFQSNLYTQDWLGLKELNDTNRLTFLHCPGNHLQMTETWIIDHLVPWLNGTL